VKMATPRYMAATASSAAKCRNKTPVNKPKIVHQKWNASPKIDNPDGPIKPLRPMNNYRAKMDAQRKKRTELLAKIEANKQEVFELIDSFQPQHPDIEKFSKIEERMDMDGWFDGWFDGWECNDKNLYSSLPPIGNEEECERLYSIDEDKTFGQGGCGMVFQGWRRSDKKKVAIKKVKKSNVAYYGNVNGQLYPIEYCHLRMVDGCSRIVNLLDAFDIGDVYTYVLETMDMCGSLLDHLRINEKPFEEPHCKLIFRQLVKAVEQCHNSGIFHRDIKIGNILLEYDTNELKLIDFDSSIMASYSPFRDNPGTDGYMSPEMYDSSAKYEGSPAAVYSMGVVLYDIVFCAKGWKLLYKQRSMLKVSNDCLDLICKMTASRPEDRLPFEKILDHHWMQSN